MEERGVNSGFPNLTSSQNSYDQAERLVSEAFEKAS